MVNEVTLQPGRARDSVNRNVDKFSSRCVYNTVIDVSDVHKGNKAPHSVWKQWLSESNTCKPVVTGRTFADVVKQNPYSCNISADKSEPLEVMQVVSRKGKPLGSGKETNISRTVSPQVRTTHVRPDKTYNRKQATGNLNLDIPLHNRFAVLDAVDEQNSFSEIAFDTVVEYRDHFECTPCSGKALSRDESDTFRDESGRF